MNGFKYYTPTKVVFGENSVAQAGELAKEFGATKVLIHYGGGSAVRSGLIGKVQDSLTAASLPYVLLGGVVPNPRLSLVNKGIELCKAEGVDFILAVGGGSVIDSSKAIAYGLYHEGDVWDFYCKKRVPQGSYPVGAVLTIAAAGSEMSDSSVITNEEIQQKRGCNSDHCRPKFALMDPALTVTLPAYQTACGCTDIIMHTLERYFTTKGNMDITDGMARAVIKTIMKNALILKDDPENIDARAEVMWTSSLSHNGLTGCGNGGNDFASHRLEHELSAVYDVAHGAGLAAIWASWARYVIDNCPDRFYKFAVDIMGIDGPRGGSMGIDGPADGSMSKLDIGHAGIDAMENFFRSIDMPTSLTELGLKVTDEDIQLLADKCNISTGGKVGAAKVLQREDFVAIYTMAR